MPSNWGDVAEDIDYGELDVDQKEEGDLLPVPTTTVDSNGIKTTIVYKEEGGDVIKTVRKTKNKVVRKKISLSALARRSRFVKFGQCKGLAKGPEKGITFPFPDANADIIFEFDEDWVGIQAGEMDDEEEEALKKKMASLKRKLDGRSTLQIGGSARERLSAWNTRNKGNVMSAMGTPEGPPATGGAYRPPSMRGGRGGSKYDDDDEPTIRITNLTEEASYEDLRELVSSFRPLKVRLAKDRITQRSRGFAFISFASTRSAQECMDALDGHGYGHLILSVEWAKSFKSVQKGGGAGGR